MQVPVGAKFDSNNQHHIDVVMRKVQETGRGDGWEIQSFDPASGLLTLTRRGILTQVVRDESAKDSYQVELGVDTKPTDGAKIAAKLEADPRYEGFFMTKFDPYLNQATLSKLADAERQCRSAVAAQLNVKPWDVQVRIRRDGGFDVELPVTYVPSKFDAKIDEVAARIVGRPGWYWESEPSAHPPRGRILPGELPTFDPVYPFEFSDVPDRRILSDADQWRFPLGIGLGGRGLPSTPLEMDLTDTAGVLLVGLAGSGKSTATQSILFNALARGWQIALINTVDKATDFAWAKPFVRDHLWGCDSVAQSIAVAKLVIEEGARRGKLLSEYGVAKLQDLPADVRAENPPLLLVADELASLLTAAPMPSGLSREMKELPEFIQMQQDILESGLLSTALATIPALYRAAGIRVIYLTQQPNEKYNFSTKLKGNLPHRVMLGTSPSVAEKGHAFRTPEKIPDVPANIATRKSIARGVGLAHLDGTEPSIFKGYYASLDDYVAATRRLGVRTTLNPEPTDRQIARLVPRVDGGGEDDGYDGSSPGASPSSGPSFGTGQRKYEPWELDPETGKPLTGFARANAARAAATKVARGV